MKIYNKASFKTLLGKWKKPSRPYEHLQQQQRQGGGGGGEEKPIIIPKDVPEGHLVVYVGEEHKRFIIRVTSLHHPLFLELLDQAKEEYGFGPNSKLCIPCDEHVFDAILNYIGGDQQHQRPCPCF